MEYTDLELSERMKMIIREIKVLPTDSEVLDLSKAPSMREIPYWSELLDVIKGRYSSLQNFYDKFIPKNFLSVNRVDFPAPEQEETTTQMIENPRLLIRDRAGAGKSAPAIKAKFALEQIVLDGGRLNTVIICPNFVMSSWESKLREYLEVPPSILSLTSKNRNKGLEEFFKGIRSENLDFTLVSYDALFRKIIYGSRDDIASEVIGMQSRDGRIAEENMTLADGLASILESSPNPFMLILDEGHNASNPEALRSKAVRRLGLEADYFYPLTGNPFPDNLEDIGELASLLDPENYPTADIFNRAYMKNPRLIRLFLRRFSKEPVIGFSDIVGSPRVNNHDPTWVEMNEDEERLYWSILDHKDFNMGTKFVLLRLAATDGKLLLPENYQNVKLKKRLEEFFSINPELKDVARRIQSSKYAALDSYVQEVVSKGEKIVIWTKLREGITTNLEKRYAQYGSLRIDGTINADSDQRRYSDRDIIRLTFQTDPDSKVLVASLGSFREGQDLHAANNAAFIMRDWSPGINDQGIGRIARRGQRKDVNIRSFLTGSTIDQGIYEKIEQIKRKGIGEAENGSELTKEQRDALSKNLPIIQQTTLRRYLANAHSHVRIMSGHMINKGGILNERYLAEGENAKIYALAYNFKWNTSYSAHTARLIKELVHEIEKNNGLINNIADLGSGPATVSRILQRPSYCVDLNRFQLENGIRECKQLGVEIQTQLGNIEDLSNIGSEQFDLVVASLVLHYGNFENGGRKRMVLEQNRVLRNGGYGIITLPTKLLDENGRALLEEGLFESGLEPLLSRTGIVRAVDGLAKDYEVYATVVKKIHGNSSNRYEENNLDNFFILSSEARYRDFGGKGKSNGRDNGILQGYRNEICSVFEFVEQGVILQSQLKSQNPPQEIKVVSRTPDEIVNILDRMMKRRTR